MNDAASVKSPIPNTTVAAASRQVVRILFMPVPPL